MEFIVVAFYGSKIRDDATAPTFSFTDEGIISTFLLLSISFCIPASSLLPQFLLVILVSFPAQTACMLVYDCRFLPL